MEEDGLGFEIVAASLRADATDISAFLPALAIKLSGALPAQTAVKYGGGGLFGKKKTVQAIDVNLGEERFHIEEQSGRLAAYRQKAVRGIVLKHEELPVDQWIDELSARMSEAAVASGTARSALKQMLEGN